MIHTHTSAFMSAVTCLHHRGVEPGGCVGIGADDLDAAGAATVLARLSGKGEGEPTAFTAVSSKYTFGSGGSAKAVTATPIIAAKEPTAEAMAAYIVQLADFAAAPAASRATFRCSCALKSTRSASACCSHTEAKRFDSSSNAGLIRNMRNAGSPLCPWPRTHSPTSSKPENFAGSRPCATAAGTSGKNQSNQLAVSVLNVFLLAGASSIMNISLCLASMQPEVAATHPRQGEAVG